MCVWVKLIKKHDSLWVLLRFGWREVDGKYVTKEEKECFVESCWLKCMNVDGWSCDRRGWLERSFCGVGLVPVQAQFSGWEICQHQTFLCSVFFFCIDSVLSRRVLCWMWCWWWRSTVKFVEGRKWLASESVFAQRPRSSFVAVVHACGVRTVVGVICCGWEKCKKNFSWLQRGADVLGVRSSKVFHSFSSFIGSSSGCSVLIVFLDSIGWVKSCLFFWWRVGSSVSFPSFIFCQTSLM